MFRGTTPIWPATWPVRPAIATDTADAHGPPLCTRCGLERELLEQLLFKLTDVQLVVGSGSTRWLNQADDELRRALAALQDTEVVRAVAVEI